MAGRSILILHGIENHRPPEHWQHWIADRLRARGEHVLYPGLPDPDAPTYERWRGALAELLEAMGGHERIVVCHSLASLLWLRAARDLPRGACDRLLLVSPPDSTQVPQAGASFRLDALDVAAVRASCAGPIRIVCGDTDPYNPIGAGSMYAEPLGAELDVIAGAGHITPDDGYGPWPSCERWCFDGGVRLTATPRPS
jgi:serine hydrolase